MSLYNMIGIVMAGVFMMLFAIGNRKKHARRRHWKGAKIFAPRHRNRDADIRPMPPSAVIKPMTGRVD
jgi:hypothetical protein